MRDVSFGQYYPASSFVHRMDARAKLLIAISYVVALFFIPTVSSFVGENRGGAVEYAIIAGVCFLAAALFLFTAIILSKVPFGSVLKSVKVLFFLLIFMTAISVFFYGGKYSDNSWRVSFWKITIYTESLLNAGMIAVRIMFLVLGPSILTLTTTPVELTDAIESLLKPLKLIKFPVHELAMIMSIALRLIPTLIEETDKIMSAQKARCADFDSGNLFKRAKALVPILIPLFVSSFRRANDLADAMDSRCYHGSKGRTRMKQMRFSYRDLVAAVVFCGVFFVILCIKYSWLGLNPFLLGLFGL